VRLDCNLLKTDLNGNLLEIIYNKIDTIHILDARAKSAHQTPSEFVTKLIQKETAEDI